MVCGGLRRYETAAGRNLNIASRKNHVNPSLLSVCFMQCSAEMPNVGARVPTRYGWVQLTVMGERVSQGLVHGKALDCCSSSVGISKH